MKKNSRIGIGINLIAMMRLVQLYYNITHEIIVYKPQVIMAQLWFYNNSTYVVYKSYIISVNCQWSSWSGYSGCTKSCGGGTQFKTRIKTIPESDGGTCFGEKENSRNCNIQNCPGKFTEVEYMFLLEIAIFRVAKVSSLKWNICYFRLDIKPDAEKLKDFFSSHCQVLAMMIKTKSWIL